MRLFIAVSLTEITVIGTSLKVTVFQKIFFASSGPLVPRFTAIITSLPAFLDQSTNSLSPNWFVSMTPQASSGLDGR